MLWYYVAEGRQAGPLSDAELESAVVAGTLQPETLLWCEGMESWVALSEARPDLGTLKNSGSARKEPAVPTVRCAECEQDWPEGETLRYGDLSVCAGCKPLFVQRIREGGRLGVEAEFAGFWIRAGAVALDTVVFLGGFAALYALVALSMGAPAMPPQENLWFNLILMVLLTTLEIFMLLRYGGTPGKLLLGLRVISGGGGGLSLKQACARSLWSTLLTLVPYVGAFLYVAECTHAARDEEKRAVHDIVCKTRVIRKS